MFKALFGSRDPKLVPLWPSLTSILPFTGRAEARDAFLVTVFSMLGHIAALGSKIGPKEQKQVRGFIRDALRLKEEDELVSLKVFQKASHGKGDFKRSAERFYELFIGNPKVLRAMIESLIYVSLFEGDLSKEKRELIVEACKIFGLSSDDFEKLRTVRVKAKETATLKREKLEQEQEAAQKRLREKFKEATSSDLDRSYLLLQLDSTATPEAIKKRYQELVYKLHPDRINVKEKDPGKMKEARARFQAILKAYQEIKKTRKIS